MAQRRHYSNKEASRLNWGRSDIDPDVSLGDQGFGLTNVNSGCMQRIADALERSAIALEDLVREERNTRTIANRIDKRLAKATPLK